MKWVLGPGLGLLLSLGCGIPEEVHTQTVRDLEKCRQDLANTRGDLDRTLAQIDQGPARPDDHARPDDPAVKRDLDELRRAREAVGRRLAQGQKLVIDLKPLAEAGKLAVAPHKGRLTVRLPDKILFEPGKADLGADGRGVLAKVAEALKDMPDRDLLVAAHTEAVPPAKGSRFRSNWDLSSARAAAIVQYLQNQGIDPRRLGAAGFSEFDPLLGEGEGPTAEGGRVEIILLPSPNELPELPPPKTG